MSVLTRGAGGLAGHDAFRRGSEAFDRGRKGAGLAQGSGGDFGKEKEAKGHLRDAAVAHRAAQKHFRRLATTLDARAKTAAAGAARKAAKEHGKAGRAADWAASKVSGTDRLTAYRDQSSVADLHQARVQSMVAGQ